MTVNGGDDVRGGEIISIEQLKTEGKQNKLVDKVNEKKKRKKKLEKIKLLKKNEKKKNGKKN